MGIMDNDMPTFSNLMNDHQKQIAMEIKRKMMGSRNIPNGDEPVQPQTPFGLSPNIDPTFSAQQQTTTLSPESQRQLMEIRRRQAMQPGDIFNNDAYRGVSLPDTAVGGSTSMSDSLLNNDEVPDEIKKKYWWVFHKDNTLTFLDEDRKKSKLFNFDIIKIDLLNAMPYYDYDFDMELKFNVLRNVFETKLDRALGFRGTASKNERIILQSQFQENRQINENDGGGQIREGFFKRLLGRR